MNAIAGYIMARIAPKHTIQIFRVASVLQVSTIYWSIRFFPPSFYNIGSHSTSGVLLWSIYRFCDVLFTVRLIGGIWGLVIFTYLSTRSKSLLIAAFLERWHWELLLSSQFRRRMIPIGIHVL
jgi:hypothetical protein